MVPLQFALDPIFMAVSKWLGPFPIIHHFTVSVKVPGHRDCVWGICKTSGAKFLSFDKIFRFRSRARHRIYPIEGGEHRCGIGTISRSSRLSPPEFSVYLNWRSRIKSALWVQWVIQKRANAEKARDNISLHFI